MLFRLYVKNLPEKVNKTDLKRGLYMLFSTYGPILDIVTNRVGAKGQTMRGQAHIVFRDIQTSTQAMRAMQGFDFCGKEMVRTLPSVTRLGADILWLGNCLRKGTVIHNTQTPRNIRTSHYSSSRS